MNKKGFTLVELLATIVLLGIIAGITLITVNGGFGNAKKKTEDVFVDTIEDAINMYLDSYESRKLHFNTTPVCEINKTHGKVKLYKVSDNVTFNNVINSSLSPITANDMVNPANKNEDNYKCKTNGTLNIYRDADYVYYYKIDKSTFKCLNNPGVLTNLPSECANK